MIAVREDGFLFWKNREGQLHRERMAQLSYSQTVIRSGG